MVLQEQTHQFLNPNAVSRRSQFDDQYFAAYASDLRGNDSFPRPDDIYSSIDPLGERFSGSMESEISQSRDMMDLPTQNEVNRPAQGLSLSLGSYMLVQSNQYGQSSLNSNPLAPNYLVSGGASAQACGLGLGDESPLARARFRNLSSSLAAAVGNSLYLKPAQSLLEETVSVGGQTVDLTRHSFYPRSPHSSRRAKRLSTELKAELCGDALSFAGKHEVKDKIANLIALLEEVERRYENYCHQMEKVVRSFESVAGFGAAKSYTAVALQAISRHFCSLRDVILSQINSARRKLAKDFPMIGSGLLRVSLLDQENKQKRTSLQQMGMVQNQRQAWRPIRGLPETSVAILRAWLFEHFLHPYPNDPEKLMLSSQTGLTKNQVSNWFINARVRLWKPMIEEMYKEEFADASEDAENDPLFASCSMSRDGITNHSDE